MPNSGIKFMAGSLSELKPPQAGIKHLTTFGAVSGVLEKSLLAV